MSEEQIAELNTWAYQPLTGNGHIHGLVLRLLDERQALLAAAKNAEWVGEIKFKTNALAAGVHDTLAAAITKAEAP